MESFSVMVRYFTNCRADLESTSHVQERSLVAAVNFPPHLRWVLKIILSHAVHKTAFVP